MLSGGERNRVHLAKVLKEGGNVLLLDEPTNDLDVDTLRALEDGLEAFAGCAVIISHDRWFLDRVATHVLAFEGRLRRCAGSRATSPSTRRSATRSSAPTPTSPTASSTSRSCAGRRPVSPRTIRRLVIAVFVIGIAGMIVGSIADNNGVAITFGLLTAAAAVGLILVTASAPPGAFASGGSPRVDRPTPATRSPWRSIRIRPARRSRSRWPTSSPPEPTSATCASWCAGPWPSDGVRR